VRGCYEPLRRSDSTYVCPRRHAYDIARSGYINLLQPQDRRSIDAGDSREAVLARAALIAAGVGRETIDAVVSHARTLALPDDGVVVELGSGSGETLGLLAAVDRFCAIGIDLSTAAAAHAARRFPDLSWVVANADRRLPLLDDSVDLVLSVHARRNPAECRRVLRESGFLIVAVPAADDLVELREAVQGAGVQRDRLATLRADHEALFTVREQSTARQRLELSREALLQLLRGTYRGARAAASARAQQLERMTVTLASDIIVFAPRTASTRG
jgi:23S rRNA (guanine745-N1)-methyltransferase